MTNAEHLRHLGGLLRRYYAPEFREPLSEDLVTLATALETRLRASTLLQVERAAADARAKPVRLKLVV